MMFETYFWGNMKALLRHLDWGLGTKGQHNTQGLCIISNVSKWSNLLLKME